MRPDGARIRPDAKTRSKSQAGESQSTYPHEM
jgi:hypothetical protein